MPEDKIVKCEHLVKAMDRYFLEILPTYHELFWNSKVEQHFQLALSDHRAVQGGFYLLRLLFWSDGNGLLTVISKINRQKKHEFFMQKSYIISVVKSDQMTESRMFVRFNKCRVSTS